MADADAESWQGDIDRVVVPRDHIARRVGQLAAQITECYRGRELTVLAVLTGSLIFLSDLIRRLPLKVRLKVMSACSYPGRTAEPKELKLALPDRADLVGRDVLVVDDILDTGRTLKAILEHVSSCGPLSVRTCVLLAKRRDTTPMPMVPDFCGFTTGPEFVVGYGLDFGDLYRNLPDICTLRPHVLAAGGRGGHVR